MQFSYSSPDNTLLSSNTPANVSAIPSIENSNELDQSQSLLSNQNEIYGGTSYYQNTQTEVPGFTTPTKKRKKINHSGSKPTGNYTDQYPYECSPSPYYSCEKGIYKASPRLQYSPNFHEAKASFGCRHRLTYDCAPKRKSALLAHIEFKTVSMLKKYMHYQKYQ